MAARRMRPGTALEKYPTAPMHRGKYFSVQNRVQKIPKMPLPWKKGLVSKISGVKTFSERALCPHLPASSSWQLELGNPQIQKPGDPAGGSTADKVQEQDAGLRSCDQPGLFPSF